MSLTHPRKHISRFTIALGIGFSLMMGVPFFSSVGLSAPIGNPSRRMNVIKSDALPQRLSDGEIQVRMADLPDWELNGDVIQSERQFADFVEAIAFVNRLVEPAEAAGHHPDIAISYNTVTITLTTHDVGGLTELDFEMAAVISEIP